VCMHVMYVFCVCVCMMCLRIYYLFADVCVFACVLHVCVRALCLCVYDVFAYL